MCGDNDRTGATDDETLTYKRHDGVEVRITVSQLKQLGIIGSSDRSDDGVRHDIGPAHFEWHELIDFGR